MMKRIVISLWTAGIAGGLFPQDLLAGAWTLPRGHVWSKVTFLRQSTDEEYVAVEGAGRLPNPAVTYAPGDRARYRFDGEYSARAVIFDLFYGVTGRFDVGLQVPFFRQQFQDTALLTGFGAPRRATGFSDIRGFLKYNLFKQPALGTAKFGFKAPTGNFVNEEGLIPVGEGQWDFDFILQLGRSFWPVPAYANVDVGYRLRLRNDEIDRDPGDEWSFLGEVGYNPVRRVMVALKLEGIRGKAAMIFGQKIPSDVKRVTYISPTVSAGPFNNLSFEAALRISVNGRSFPAGQMLVLGVSYSGNPFRKEAR